MATIKTLVPAALIGLSALTFLTAPAGAATDPPATQAVSCSGTLIYSKTDPSGFGELAIYYNTSNGGTNSACFYHRGAAYGKTADTAVQIARCAERSGEGQPCTPVTSTIDSDEGNYAYYAGPAGVTGAANYCVAAFGSIDWNGHLYNVSSNRRGCPN